MMTALYSIPQQTVLYTPPRPPTFTTPSSLIRLTPSSHVIMTRKKTRSSRKERVVAYRWTSRLLEVFACRLIFFLFRFSLVSFFPPFRFSDFVVLSPRLVSSFLFGLSTYVG